MTAKKPNAKRGGARKHTGRKKGVPNRSTIEVKKLVQGIVDFEKLIRRFAREANRRGKLTHVGYLCGVKLMEYGLGKPAQTITIAGSLTEEQASALRSLADKAMEESV